MLNPILRMRLLLSYDKEWAIHFGYYEQIFKRKSDTYDKIIILTKRVSQTVQPKSIITIKFSKIFKK